MVRYHLANGVDVDYAHPEFQSTALVSCLLAGQVEVADLLLDHCADPCRRSPFDDLTPVDAALRIGAEELAGRLRARCDAG